MPAFYFRHQFGNSQPCLTTHFGLLLMADQDNPRSRNLQTDTNVSCGSVLSASEFQASDNAPSYGVPILGPDALLQDTQCRDMR